MYINQRQDQKYKTISSQQDTRNPTTNKKVIYYTPVHGSTNGRINKVNKHQNKQLDYIKQKPNTKYHTPNKKYQVNSFLGHTHNSFKNVNLQKKHQQKNKRSNSYHVANNRFENNQHKIKQNKIKRFNRSMYQNLKQVKQQCIRTSRYRQAKQIDTKLKSLSKQRAKSQMKSLLKQHKLQKKQLKKAHSKQMAKFQQLWAKEQLTMIEFKKAQQQDVKRIQNNIVERCKSFKTTSSKLIYLDRLQKSYIKLNAFDQLIELQKQRSIQKQKLLQSKQQRLVQIAQYTQQSLKQHYTKRYLTLIHRLQQNHNDKYRNYQRQSLRLKRKYQNILTKIDHQQTLQIRNLQIGKKLINWAIQ